MFLIKTCKRQYIQRGLHHYIKKSIFLSQSKDIYTNLALEDWLYRYFDFTQHHILMLWQSTPCVVIGKHQNPWLEANVEALPNITKTGVKLARRNSGGGTVYHDMGNLNLSFFCPKERYNRKYNLEIIAKAVRKLYNLEIEISPREDLNLNGFKVSGTASKLGRPNSYHHCTLLVNATKADISEALRKNKGGVEIITNATKSVPSPVKNLCEDQPDVSIENLSKAIALEYLRTPILGSDQTNSDEIDNYNANNEFHVINPSNEQFAGLDALREELSTWNWCFGRTPKFTVSKMYDGGVKLSANVEKGCVTDVRVNFPNNFCNLDCQEDINFVTGTEGSAYTPDFMHLLEDSIVSDHFCPKEEHKHIVDLLKLSILSNRREFKWNVGT